MSNPAIGLLAAAALFLIAGLLLPLERWSRRLGATVPYLPGLVASILIGLAAAAILASGQPSSAPLPGLVPGTESLVRLDPIGTYFLVLLAAAGTIVFGFLALARPGGEHPAALHALLLGQLGVIAAGDGVLFLLAWGISAVAGAVLAIGCDDELRSARTALASGFLALMLLAGSLLAIGGTSGLAFQALEASARKLTPGHQAATALAVFVALLALAAILPFHRWHRGSAGRASGGGRALYAGLVATTAVYSLLRILGGWLRGGPDWLALLVIAVGAMAALRGALAALVETELARLLHGWAAHLAGLTIVGLGTTLAFIGHGGRAEAALALTASLMAASNLVLLATPLVLLGRELAASAETGELDLLAGRGARTPVVRGALLVVGAGIAAVPALGGFLPTWLAFAAMLQPLPGPATGRAALTIGVAATAIGVGLSVACLIRLAVLLGGDRQPAPRRAGGRSAVAAAAVGLAALPIAAYTLAAPWTAPLLQSLARDFGRLGGLADGPPHPQLVAAATGSARVAAELAVLGAIVYAGLLALRALGATPAAGDARRRPAETGREPRLTAAGLAQPIAATLDGAYLVDETIRPVLSDAPYVPTAIEVSHAVTPPFDDWIDHLDGQRLHLGEWRDRLIGRLPDLGVGWVVVAVLALLLGYA